MQSIKTLKHHAELVDTMASKLAVDLQEQALRGNISVSEIDDAVLTCTACSNPDACQKFLVQDGKADATPSYCRNTELFEELKAK